MAVTTGPRTGVTLWSAVDGSDPVSRAQFQASHQALEDRAAVDYQQTLPLPAAGTRGRYLWVTDDRGGRLYRDDGATLWDLGPKPIDGPAAGYTARITAHPSAAVADDVLQLRGKTGQTGDLLRATDPTGGTSLFRVDSTGALYANAFAQIAPATAAGVGLIVNGLTGQTGDLQRWNVAGATKATVTAAGSIQSTSDLYAQLATGNQVRVGVVGSGAAAGVELGAPTHYIGNTGGPVSIVAGGTMVSRHWSNGEISIGAGQAGGTYRLNVLGPAGSNPPVYLRSTAGSTGDGNYQINLSHTGDAIGGWLIGHEGAANGKLKLAWEAGGGPGDKWTLDTGGVMSTGAGQFTNNPGTNQTAHPAGTYISGRGLTVTADSATIQGGVSAGVGVAVARVDPALSVNNTAGPLLTGYNATQLQARIDQGGNLSARGSAYIGPSAFGATGNRLRVTASDWVYLWAENEGGTGYSTTFAVLGNYIALQPGPAPGTGTVGFVGVRRASDGTWLMLVDGQTGQITGINTLHYLGPGGNGTGARLRVEVQSTTQVNLTSENQSATWQTLDLRGSTVLLRTGTGDPILSAGPKPASGTQTGVQIWSWETGSWGSNAIQYGPNGSGPGGVGRALWIS